MKYKEFYTVLPLQNNAPHVLQGVVQGDTANIVNCTLVNGDEPFNFTGYTDLVLDILKPDGFRIKSLVTSESVYNVDNPYMIDVVEPENGRISFTLHGQATIVTGTYFAQISLYSEGVLMTTIKLNYVVQESMSDINADEFSGSDYSGIKNIIARWSEFVSSENERRAAENVRLERDDERSQAEANREARMSAMEDAINAYLELADFYVDQTEANKDACRAYAQLAAVPSAEVLQTILSAMDIPDKDYVDTQDQYYATSDIDGKDRKIQMKRMEETAIGHTWTTFKYSNTSSTLTLVVDDQEKFSAFYADCVSQCSASDDFNDGPNIVYKHSTEKWSLYFSEGGAVRKSFEFDEPETVGLTTTGAHSGSLDERWHMRVDMTNAHYAITEGENLGDAVISIDSKALLDPKLGNQYFRDPAIFDLVIEYTDGAYKAMLPIYNETPVYSVSNLDMASWGLSVEGTPVEGDTWTISVMDESMLDFGEIGIFGNDVFIGNANSGKIQLTGHYATGSTPPTRTDIFWVDTNNNAMLKYYNGTAWVACNTAVFG